MSEDFAGCVRMLLKTFSNRIEVKHGVPILLGGCSSGKVVRCLAEVDAWLASLQESENFPVAARRASLLAMRNAGSGSQPKYEVRIRMPATLASHDRITALVGMTYLQRLNPLVLFLQKILLILIFLILTRFSHLTWTQKSVLKPRLQMLNRLLALAQQPSSSSAPATPVGSQTCF
jgi:hypothetical protein